MARSALSSIRCGIFGSTSSSQSLQRFLKPVTRPAAGIAVERTELFIAACAVESGSLDTHGVEIGPHGAKPPRLRLDPFHQCRAVPLAAKPLLDPEQLDEQDRHPYLADNAADDRPLVTQRDGEAAILLLAQLLVVVTDQPAENRALGLSNRALSGDRRHRISSSPRSPTIPRAPH